MIFVEKENIEDLSEPAVLKQINGLVTALYKNKEYFVDVDVEYLRSLLSNIVESLDDADQMDSFGTEGWRHSFS